MLTGDLVRTTVKGRFIVPTLISVVSSRNIERASELLMVFRDAVEHRLTRMDLEKIVRDMASIEVDHKLLKGLGKILFDRSDFVEPCLPIEPSPSPREIREIVFRLSAQEGMFSSASVNSRKERKQIIELVANRYNCSVSDILDYLYADLREMQQISNLDDFLTPLALLQRYNVALCQAVLLRATDVQVVLMDPSPKWLRLLFKFIKFHRLMFTVKKQKGKIICAIDGPQSLFQQSTKYGIQLALFLPALILQPTAWTLQANLLWGKKRKYNKKFKLNSEMGLQSHYKSTGTWRSQAEIWFEERFLQKDTDWIMDKGEIIVLPGQQVIIPDFSFSKGKVKAYMEILGFWRGKRIESLLEQCPDNLIVAVSKRLSGQKNSLPEELQNKVVVFADIISPAKIIKKLDEIYNNKIK